MNRFVVRLVWSVIFGYILAILVTAGYFGFQVWGW